MGRDKRQRGTGRDPGGFIALPWLVMDCPAYCDLSYSARALLLEFARQFVRNNNGKLIATKAYLEARGWSSTATIAKAKQELLQAGFIYETVKGARPNKAAWYALTWLTLDMLTGYDPGSVEGFRRGAYRDGVPLQAGMKN